MDASAPQLLQAIESSGLGLAIRQSVWIYPAANVGHVVAIVGFAGAVAVMDLVLLGAIRPERRAVVIGAARRCSGLLLLLVFATGAVLFIAEASHVALNLVFQIKVALIALGLVNALTLGRRGTAAALGVADAAPLPPIARVAAAASLAIWLAVAGLGRLIAYV